ncbi:MAG: GNAT family N-acetyltransferase [Pseudomonadales bacterium 32-42-5]|nr:MAG: GNAT family N-acetyltransferase [Pseudomonadales bacterium 32-42-5]
MLKYKIEIISATIADYPIIQNLARFYVYDRSGYMEWGCEKDGMFECIDFKHYFINSEREAFLIKVDNEITGFVLLYKINLLEPVNWNMGEFFIIAKFQGKGIASFVAKEIFRTHPGKWSVAVMPENIKAVHFWRKIIKEVSDDNYTEVFKTADELRCKENPDPYDMNIMEFICK